jgi:phosphoglycolate phosphatase-like HAD superfamily hydrolase
LIGDTEHDLACAVAAGFDCLLVRGGHTSDADLDTLDCRVLPDLFAVKEVLLGAAT